MSTLRLLFKIKCIIEDDMQELYPLIEEAEGFIIATPIHCGE